MCMHVHKNVCVCVCVCVCALVDGNTRPVLMQTKLLLGCVELAGPPPPPPPPPSMAPNAPPPNVQESAPRSGLGITLGWDENANTNDWGPFTYEVQAHVVGEECVF